MPVHSAKNLYPGINPHLNSALQQSGGDWESFHAYHLIVMAQTLNKILPEGYIAKPEQSLQIKVYDPPEERISKSKADVLLLRGNPSREPSLLATERTTPTLTLPIGQVIEDLDELTALLIYRGKKPIVRIELLSPANKPGGSHFELYVSKRAETLHSGLCFVEIDYLHESRPTIPDLPSYPESESNAFPYHIVVMNPHPSFEDGPADIYGFGVMDRLPIIEIPLEGKDSFLFNIGTAYNLTYEERPFYSEVDYAQEPVNFAAYSEADQANIRQKMAEVAAR